MSANFEVKEVDQEGLDVLDVVAKAHKLNTWMFKTIEPFCKGAILEIGSGIGNISQYFVLNQYDISVSDLRENYRIILKNKFQLPDDKVLNLDIVDVNFGINSKDLINKYDSIFSLNVVEHIKNDDLAIKNMVKMLKPGGT